MRLLIKFWMGTPAGKLQFTRLNDTEWLMGFTKGGGAPVRLCVGATLVTSRNVADAFGWSASLTPYSMVYDDLPEKVEPVRVDAPTSPAPVAVRGELVRFRLQTLSGDLEFKRANGDFWEVRFKDAPKELLRLKIDVDRADVTASYVAGSFGYPPKYPPYGLWYEERGKITPDAVVDLPVFAKIFWQHGGKLFCFRDPDRMNAYVAQENKEGRE